jgi:uncharacterized protein
VLIDCDVHPVLGSTRQLLPYVDEYWAETLDLSGHPQYVPNHHPPGAPITERPDATRDDDGLVAHAVGPLCHDVLDRGGADLAILHCLYGVQHVFNPMLERTLARALNCWIAEYWLDVEPRLRAAIVLPMRAPQAAVEEIERWTDDPRFVSVLVPAQSELLYGREAHWPVWDAAARARLSVTIHLGGLTDHAPTVVGWPSSYLEWYVGQQASLEAQLASMICAGVFQRCPDLRVVLAECGTRWVPSFLWRFTKLWKALRRELPWLDRSPIEIAREHVRLTTAPDDGLHKPGQLDELVERIGSDRMLLYASDYPHWHATDPEAVDAGTSDRALRERIHHLNPVEAFPRIAQAVASTARSSA